MWGPDAPPVPPKVALRWFTIAVLSFATFGVVTKLALVPERPAVAREYPYSGLITELGGLEENQVGVMPLFRKKIVIYVRRHGHRAKMTCSEISYLIINQFNPFPFRKV